MDKSVRNSRVAPSRAMIALAFCTFFPSCIARPKHKLEVDESATAKLATISITPPQSISTQIESKLVNGVSVEIVPGECADGSTGTRLQKTVMEVQTGIRLDGIKVKSACSYKVLIEMGRLDTAGKNLQGVYLTNLSSPTLLKPEDVKAGNVSVTATLRVTDEGKPIITGRVSPPSDSNGSTDPGGNSSPGQNQNSAPQPDATNGRSVRLDFIRYNLPPGYQIAQTAKDGSTRMASVTRQSKKLVLYSRSDRCSLKQFLSSSSHVVGSEKTYRSRSGLVWETQVSKFSSTYTGATTYNGIFIYPRGNACAFGYVSASSPDLAESEMKVVLDGTTLVQ